MDIVIRLDEELKLIQRKRSDIHNNGFGIADDLETLSHIIMDIFDEVNDQFDYSLNKQDLKATLNGLKHLVVKQQDMKNKKKWNKWEKEAVNGSLYYRNLEDIWYEDPFFDNNRSPYVTHINGQSLSPLVKPLTRVVARYTHRPKKTLTKWRVVLTTEIAIFIKKMMALNKSVEWGVAFTWLLREKDKLIVIDKVYIMPVITSGGEVKFLNESEFTIFANISELGEFVTDIDNKTRFAGIMHSHHSMGSWHSSTDHGTIGTYINDFKQVLSIVWAYQNKKEGITGDVILENDKNKYLVKNKNIVFMNTLDIDDERLTKLDSDLVTKYESMMNIVEKDYIKYKEYLSRFDDTGKYIKIKELYELNNNEEIKCISKEIIKELI